MVPLKAIYTSPLERAVQTGTPIAALHRINLEASNDLGELNVGAWEGKPFNDLEECEHWRRFNAYRSGVRPPGGESMLEVQSRMMRQIGCIQQRHPDEYVAVISHADPLRTVLMHFLGMPLDQFLRIEISPASVSVVQMDRWGAKVLCMNHTPAIRVHRDGFHRDALTWGGLNKNGSNKDGSNKDGARSIR